MAHDHDHHEHSHDHDHHGTAWRAYAPAVLSFLLLAGGLAIDHVWKMSGFAGWVRLVWYGAAYAPVALPVVWKGARLALQGDVFTEFFLMGIATLGAFALGEYPEGVAVMLFYTIGELFQDAAVHRAKRSIKALLDVRPDRATVLRDGDFREVRPESVQVGETIRLRPGERVPLDGALRTAAGTFDTAALTGESVPRRYRSGDLVLAGMVNLENVSELEAAKPYDQSSIARILHLVQDASARKAPTELFLRKFARVYTPLVVLLAALLVLVPAMVVPDYSFREWLYRALIFLVISCPCALVISIPLGYFGGLGTASRQGILFKGSNFLDRMTAVDTVVLDKTGTLTRGVFQVQKMVRDGIEKQELLRLAAALEQHSTHPVAVAILAFARKEGAAENLPPAADVREIAGQGLAGTVAGRPVLAGNLKLLQSYGIAYPPALDAETDTLAVVAAAGRYAGHFVIADEIKPDAAEAVRDLRAAGVRELVLLSGDHDATVQKIVQTLDLDRGFGNLLPEQKLEKLTALKSQTPARTVAFVGDGLNDAPVLAAADVGIAMGGLGSDAAIETADVVIQTDEPSKVATAIRIGRATRQIVWQNIGLAFGVKLLVLLLGAGGLATMWEAVFADVGVALLAIGNAVRVQRMNF